jgi:DNA-binding response OmpR family regulator
MPRILTVDDSRAIRLIVAKQLAPLNFEIGEAEDGNDGLKQLQAAKYDLVVLDVTMPNLDGPGMLGKMRESGNQTPVLMLTSESKTTIVAALMKMGISDYVLKPFKGEELKAKVLKALKLPADYAPGAAAAAAPAGPVALVIDDMDNVHKKLRSMIPENVVLDTALTAADGLAQCRSKKYGLIIVDGELPDTNLTSLNQQIRLLQAKATIVATALRTANNITGEMRGLGFDDVLFKPFASDALDGLLDKCFSSGEELEVKENCLKLLAYHGKEDKLEKYFQRVAAKMKEAMSKMAEACYDKVVLDATAMPLAQPLYAAQFMIETCKAGSQVGISVRAVGQAELAKVVGGFEETKDVRFFNTLEEARAA